MIIVVLVVVVLICNATRHPRHIVAAVNVLSTGLYSPAFMAHSCTLGAAVQFTFNPGNVKYQLSVLMV